MAQIGRAGPQAAPDTRSVVANLKKALKEAQVTTRVRAALDLWKANEDPAALPVLIAALDSKDATASALRMQILRILSERKGPDGNRLSAVRKSLRDQ